MPTFWLFAFCLINSYWFVGTEQAKALSLTVEISDKERHCFYEQFNISIEIVFSYKLLRGGLRDFIVNVDVRPDDDLGSSATTVSTKEVLYKKSETATDRFVIPVKRGIYVFCFLNDFPRPNTKLVNFALSPSTKERYVEYTLIDGSLRKLVDNLTTLLHDQYQQTAHDVHRQETAKRLNDFVMWWSLVELCAAFVLGLGQLFMLKAIVCVKSDTARQHNYGDVLNVAS